MSELSNIDTWRRLNTDITTSGQPTETQLAELKTLGIEHVINLGLHSHERALSDEAASLASLGITYTHIPVEFDNPTEGDFAKFCDAMSSIVGKTVHVYCIANLRVSAFLYRWQRDVMGVDEEQARHLMDSIWRPGGVWAAFVGDETAIELPHRPPE